MGIQQEKYFAYLLRIWCTEHNGQWKASLEDPQTGLRLGFGDIQALFDFLLGRIDIIHKKQNGEEDERGN